MDDTAQKQNQTNDKVQSQTQPQPQPQVTPVGTVNKEVEAGTASDYVMPSEPEIVKEKEVKEVGVKEVLEAPRLTKEQERVGIKPSAETTPVPSQPSGNVQLPMTQAQAKQVAQKNKNIRSSIVWLAILMLKHFKKVHRKLMGKVF
jgi:hypothetical protein